VQLNKEADRTNSHSPLKLQHQWIKQKKPHRSNIQLTN